MTDSGMESYLDEQERAALPPLHSHVPDLTSLEQAERMSSTAAQYNADCMVKNCPAEMEVVLWVLDGNTHLQGGWHVELDPYDPFNDGPVTQEEVDRAAAELAPGEDARQAAVQRRMSDWIAGGAFKPGNCQHRSANAGQVCLACGMTDRDRWIESVAKKRRLRLDATAVETERSRDVI